jgi:arabinose-5-phosphate isomerase
MMQNMIELARTTIRREVHALELAAERIDASFELAVDLILSSTGKVIAAGLGKSGLVARKIAATFCSIGTPAVYLHPVEATHGDFGVIQKGDVVLLVSKSGETPEVLTFLKLAKAADCRVVGIVGRRDSRATQECDVSLDASVAVEACPLNLAPTSSAVVAVAIGDALAACLVERRGFTPSGFGRLHPSGSLGKRLLLRVKDVMHHGDVIPLVGPECTMKDAIVVLSSMGMGIVFVAGPDRELLGVFTDGDLRRCLQKYDRFLEMQIDSLMTRCPVVCHVNQMAIEAVELMENRSSQISALPVVDGDRKIAGVVRIHDLVRSGL